MIARNFNQDARQMEKIDRIQRLHRLLTSYRHPVPTSTLVERMQCSEFTVKRDIEYLQDCFNAPIEYDKERRGWHYNLKQDEKFELPGLWLTTEELQSLIALITIINSFDEGVLAKETGIIEHAIEDMLRVRGIEQSQITQKIKYLPIAKCFTDSTVFMSVCETLFRSVQTHLTYVDRSGKQTHRTVSPQTLLPLGQYKLYLPDGLSEYMAKVGVATVFTYKAEWLENWTTAK